jgi:hypothetical protein
MEAERSKFLMAWVLRMAYITLIISVVSAVGHRFAGGWARP